MRELKFRAWHNGIGYPTPKMVYDPKVKGEGLLSLNEMFSDPKKEVTIMQYTGLKDKNGKGKEVYHKDLFLRKADDGFFSRTDQYGVVEWIDDGWYVKFSTYEVRLFEYLRNKSSREVIGNKYENPELV